MRHLAELGAPVNVSQDELLASMQAILRSGENLATMDSAVDKWHERRVSLYLSLCLELAQRLLYLRFLSQHAV